MSPDIAVVHADAVTLQSSSLFELLLAHVARMPPDIDVVHVGAVLLQVSSLFELSLANVADMPPATALGRRRVQLTQEERELVDHGRRRRVQLT